MKVLRNILVATLTLYFANFALAGANIVGKVTQIRVDVSGQGIVWLSGVGTGAGSCVIPYYASSLAFNINTAGGKSLLALLMLARSKGTNIHATGTGSCAVYGSVVEDLASIIEY